MAEYTGFRADLWRRLGELISSVSLNSLDDIQGMDDKGLTLVYGRKHSWASMSATDDEVRIILRRWSAYQRVRMAAVGPWNDFLDECAEQLVVTAELNESGQPWTVRPLHEAFAPTDAPSSTFMNTLTEALTADSLRDTYEAMARMQEFMYPGSRSDSVLPPLRAPSNTAYQARTTATDLRFSLDGVPVKLTSPSGIDIKYAGVIPVPPIPSTSPAPLPSRWALLELDEAANPEAVVQAWREAQARRKAKPRVPAYHETILDLTECNMLDAVLRCADMWDELDRADRRKRMN